MFSWFIDADYREHEQLLIIELHPEMVKRLSVFKSYTNIDYQTIFSLDNGYSLRVYMSCKIMLTRYSIENSVRMSLYEFKENIGLFDKYEKPSLLEKYVLNIVKAEINSKTDINFDYELHKTGRKFTEITIKFSMKKENKEITTNTKVNNLLLENKSHETLNRIVDKELDQESKTALLQLRSYGIQQKQASDLINKYGVGACKIGVERLLGEIDKGNEIKNISGYLVKCIQSQSEVVSSDHIQAAKQAAQEIEEKKHNEKMARFQSFNKYIKSNEQDILVLFHHYKAKNKLTNANDINMLECLKDAVNEYIDLKDNDLVLTTRFDSDLLYYDTISDLVSNLKVASNKERIALLKTDLVKKKQELDGADDSVSPILEKEISMIQAEIVELI